jgi:hypothetical protein
MKRRGFLAAAFALVAAPFAAVRSRPRRVNTVRETVPVDGCRTYEIAGRFVDFGTGRLVRLHGAEGVIPVAELERIVTGGLA